MKLLPLFSITLVLASGCFIDRSGTLVGDTDGGDRDAGPRFDGGDVDGGSDAGSDAGFIPPPDACVPVDETCNNMDDDCDGVVDDGVSRDCANACGAPGTETCSLGMFDLCTAPPEPLETCDGTDEDCDGSTDEGLTRPCRNRCGMMGTEACTAGSYGGCTAPAEPTETCNGLDDDCDGSIDESAGCPCTRRVRLGQVYLFCTSATTWTMARAACRALGYELVTIGNSGENTFVTTNALSDADDDWFIGINDRATDRTWVWSSGSGATYRNWDTGEPDNFMADAWDCGVIENGSNSNETRGMWADMACGESRPYICEAP